MRLFEALHIRGDEPAADMLRVYWCKFIPGWYTFGRPPRTEDDRYCYIMRSMVEDGWADGTESREEAEARYTDYQKWSEQRSAERQILHAKMNAYVAAECPLRHMLTVASGGQDECKPWAAARDRIRAGMKRPGGMLVALLGPRGCGKTLMAVDLIYRRIAEDGWTSRYVRIGELFRDVRRAFAKPGQGEQGLTEAELFESWCEWDTLFIDECHQRGETTHENNTLVSLIDERYTRRKRTILIANQTPEEFGDNVGDSVVSRLHETGEAITCNWPSFRVRGQWTDGDRSPTALEKELRGTLRDQRLMVARHVFSALADTTPDGRPNLTIIGEH
jgi:DNA replication protein DnaC